MQTAGNYLFLNSNKTWGGSETKFLKWAQELNRRGHRTTLAGRRGGVYLNRLAELGLDVLPLSLSCDFMPFDVLRLHRWLREHKPQAIFCTITRDVRLASRTLRWTKGLNPKVLWVSGSILLKRTRRHQRLVDKYVDHIIVPSAALKHDLLQFDYVDPATVEVVPNGLDLRVWSVPTEEEVCAARRNLHVADDQLIVGVFARLEPCKGHRSLLDAWEVVHRKHPQAELWIAGTGADEEELRRLIDTREIPGVKMIGFVKNVREVMLACDIVVQPSLSESFCHSLVEAMACAKPIVCTRVGGMPEVVAENETALLAKPENSSDLAAALSTMLSNQTSRTKFGKAGRRRAEQHFSLPATIDQLETLLPHARILPGNAAFVR